MKHALALLMLLLALPAPAQDTPDGGLGFYDYKCPNTPLKLVPVDGGYFLPEARATRDACIQAATEKHRDLLLVENQDIRDELTHRTKDTRPYLIGTAITFVMGLFAGAYLYYQLGGHHP